MNIYHILKEDYTFLDAICPPSDVVAIQTATSIYGENILVERQDWNDKELDKDIINPDNKVYCPEYCVFVTPMTNTFIIDSGAIRGEWPIGVYWNEQNSKFKAQCCNPLTRKSEYLGLFTCPQAAHQAWKKYKHELALELAELQDNMRVAAALRIRYL